MSKTITVRKAKEALEKLRKLTPANPKTDDDLKMTVKEAVFFMGPDLIRMSKRGFTSKELADGLAVEGVKVKPGTLNRYLNEYAEKDLDKSKTSLGAAEEDPDPGTGVAETGKEETSLENPNSALEYLNPDEKAAGDQSGSDSPPENQSAPSTLDRE